MAQEKPGQTLQATALVHEASRPCRAGMRRARDPHWNSRGHFSPPRPSDARIHDSARRKKTDKMAAPSHDLADIDVPGSDQAERRCRRCADALSQVDAAAAKCKLRSRGFAGGGSRHGARHFARRLFSPLDLCPRLVAGPDAEAATRILIFGDV
jgi:hypothetical protein